MIMSPKKVFSTCLFLLLLYGKNTAQEDTLDLSARLSSILFNASWQAQDGDTTARNFCLLEFSLPDELLADAYCFQLDGLRVADDKGRFYDANAFAVSPGEQTLHRDYRLIQRLDDGTAASGFRVKIDGVHRDVRYFTLEGHASLVFPERDATWAREFSTLDWQSLYESLLADGIQLVFAAQSRSLMEQMANLGSMSPEGQEDLNAFLESNSMYLQEPLFPENTNLLLDDPNKDVLKIEILGPDGQPVPHKSRRSYAGGALYFQQQYEAPLSGEERIRVMIATEKNLVKIPFRLEKIRLPW